MRFTMVGAALFGAGCGSPAEAPVEGRDAGASEKVELHRCANGPLVFDGSDGVPVAVVVPPYCSRMVVKAWGAGGSSWAPGALDVAADGGGGGYAAAAVPIAAGTRFWVRPGATNGDGSGGQSSVVALSYGASGIDALTDLVAVAGGGGGGGLATLPDLVPGAGGAGGGNTGRVNRHGERALGFGVDGWLTALGGGGGGDGAGGLGGRSATAGIGAGGVGPAFAASWSIGGPAGEAGAGAGGQGWWGGGGATSSGLGWLSGAGGGGASSWVTANATVAVRIGGEGAVPGNPAHPERGGAGEGGSAGVSGAAGRVVVVFDRDPTAADMPLDIEVSPGQPNRVSVDPPTFAGPTGVHDLASAVGLADNLAWDIDGGVASGPTNQRDLAYDPIAAGTFVTLTVSGDADCGHVEATRRVHADFVDQADGPWDAFVAVLRSRDLVDGCTRDGFCPTGTVSRAELPEIVLRAREGSDYVPQPCKGTVFADVDPNLPACAWIEDLAARGVVSGCGGGNYCPNDPVTREQAAVFVLGTLESPGYVPDSATPLPFTDVDPASPFARWIAELSFRGITAGCGGTSYCPSASLTRQEMAAFVAVGFDLVFAD